MICALGIMCATTYLVSTFVNFISASVINYLFIYLHDIVHVLVYLFPILVSFARLNCVRCFMCLIAVQDTVLQSTYVQGKLSRYSPHNSAHDSCNFPKPEYIFTR